jgi:hypothetical protein
MERKVSYQSVKSKKTRANHYVRHHDSLPKKWFSIKKSHDVLSTNETFKVKTNKNKMGDVCTVEGESQ